MMERRLMREEDGKKKKENEKGCVWVEKTGLGGVGGWDRLSISFLFVKGKRRRPLSRSRVSGYPTTSFHFSFGPARKTVNPKAPNDEC